METSEPKVDDDGFLDKEQEWTRKVAELLARKNYIVKDQLTEEHWKVIEFVRKHYLDCGDGPMISKISKGTGLTSRQICELFPCGVVKGAFRLAGLPRPPGCV